MRNTQMQIIYNSRKMVMNKMLCSLKETETSGKALQGVAFGMSIEGGGSRGGAVSIFQAEEVYRMGLIHGRRFLYEEQNMCRAGVGEKPVKEDRNYIRECQREFFSFD